MRELHEFIQAMKALGHHETAYSVAEFLSLHQDNNEDAVFWTAITNDLKKGVPS